MSDDSVLEFQGVVLQELYSGHYRVLADRGVQILDPAPSPGR